MIAVTLMNRSSKFPKVGLLSVILLTVMVQAASTLCAESPTLTEAAQDWQTQLRKDVAFLCSEELRGRSVADQTIDQAADHVASRMKEIGLQTDLFDGTPMQEVEIPLGARAGTVENNRITFIPAGESDAKTLENAHGKFRQRNESFGHRRDRRGIQWSCRVRRLRDHRSKA